MTRIKFVVVFMLMAAGAALAEMEPPDGYVPGSSPIPPAGLVASWESTDAGEEVHLTWDQHPDTDLIGYIVYRSLASDYGYVKLNTQDSVDNDLDGETDEIAPDYELITGVWYEDKSTGLDPDRVYYYRITAVIEDYFESNWSEAVSTGGDGESLFGCFIATAAFGSPLADEVEILQSFRDRFLIQNVLGRKFVNCYYRLSPPVADFIKAKPLVKFIIRLHLKQVVRVVKKIMQ